MSFHVGDLWCITVQVTEPRTPKIVKPSSIAITITLPDQTESKPSIPEVEEGVYEARVSLTQEGKWYAVVATTGTYQASRPASINVLAG